MPKDFKEGCYRRCTRKVCWCFGEHQGELPSVEEEKESAICIRNSLLHANLFLSKAHKCLFMERKLKTTRQADRYVVRELSLSLPKNADYLYKYKYLKYLLSMFAP